jgi:hypothetical protein
MPRSSKCSLCLMFPRKTLYAPFLSHMCHMPCPSHSSWFDHPDDILWWIQIINFRIM